LSKTERLLRDLRLLHGGGSAIAAVVSRGSSGSGGGCSGGSGGVLLLRLFGVNNQLGCDGRFEVVIFYPNLASD
jgi:hypothetical protein